MDVVGDWSGNVGGRKVVAADLRRFECAQSGERIDPPEAIRQLEALRSSSRRGRFAG